MKKTLERYITVLRSDAKTQKYIYMLTISLAVLLLIIPLKDSMVSGRYIVDRDSNVVGIERSDGSEEASFELMLEISDENETERKEITINTRRQDEKQDSVPEVEEKAKARQRRELEIRRIVSEIESSTERRITLPAVLSDGSTLAWHRKDETPGTLLVLVITYVIIVVLLVKSSIDSENKPISINKSEIIRSLPRFVNQIVMITDSGMILSDALYMIGDSYRMIPEDERGYFERQLIDILDNNDGYSRSCIMALSDFSRSTGVKELIRISTILVENEKRGSDARANLRRESDYLWDSRKIIASEKGKLIDTKMAFPLGILLILLILVTMSPALLTM